MNEFNIVQNHFDRIGKVCGDRFKDIFEKKNIPIWIVVFNKFTKLGLPDEKFVEFLDALKRELHNKISMVQIMMNSIN